MTGLKRSNDEKRGSRAQLHEQRTLISTQALAWKDDKIFLSLLRALGGCSTENRSTVRLGAMSGCLRKGNTTIQETH